MYSWIVPCNIKYYDVDGVFRHFNRVDWKQSAKNIMIGDIVYIYVSAPIKAIKYKCIVKKVLMEHIEIDDSHFVLNGEPYINAKYHMQLELLRKYEDELTFENLKRHGLKGNIQSARKANSELECYFETI